MPIYEYQCTNCGSEFEKMVRFSEANKNPECPYCASSETHKKISLFASQGSSFGGLPLAQAAAAVHPVVFPERSNLRQPWAGFGNES